MEKFIVLQRDFGDRAFSAHTIEAENASKAWEIIEDEITGNMTQEWLLTPQGAGNLADLIKKEVKGTRHFIVIEIDGGATELPDKKGEFVQVNNCQILWRGDAGSESAALCIAKAQQPSVDFDRLQIEVLEI